MREETLRDAAEKAAYEELEAKYGDISWRETYVEFIDLVVENLRSRKFVQNYNREHGL